MNKEQLVAYANRSIASALKGFEKLSEDLKNDPIHTVKWSSNLFVEAANLKVANHILQLAEGGCDITTTVENLLEHMTSGASRVPASSSAVSNMLDQEVTAAYAREYKHLHRYIPKTSLDSSPKG